MLLYLCSGNLVRFDTVELIDGCYPRITYDVVHTSTGNDRVRSPPPTEEYSISDLDIEPALWGIILILDKVTVDISKRRFSWAIANAGKILDDEDADDLLYQTHYADDERYEYDDNIDELFKLAEHLIKISHSRTKSTRESHEEQSCLIRMLYCCILPKIQIYQKDLEQVEKAIKKQMLNITKIEDAIDRVSRLLSKSREVLYKQQDERLQQFQCIAAEKKCTKRFVQVLNDDLMKRKAKLNEQIDEHTYIVEKVKEDIRKYGETTERKTQLQEARQPRDCLQKKLEPILMATADTLKEALSSRGFKIHDKETIVLEYLKTIETTNKLKLDTECHTDKKVRATSILENLKRIKVDITREDGVAGAISRNPSGVRPTDVIIGNHVPEYQTLSERVGAIVQNPEHPLGGEFVAFTRKIKECCQDILEDVESTITSNENNTPQLQNDYLVVENDGTLQKEYLTPLENLCKDIKNHFEHMAQLFLEQFNSHHDVLKRKLQLCYEENFYNEVGQDITKIYEMAYEQHKRKMTDELISLSTYPIKCLELGMKEEWWLQLFEKRRQASVARENRQRSVRISIQRNSESLSSDSASPPEDETLKKPRKRSKGTIRSNIIKFIRRKSKEVTQETGEIGSNGAGNSNCYDNYHGDSSLRVNNMSGAIEAQIPNGTNKNTRMLNVTNLESAADSEQAEKSSGKNGLCGMDCNGNEEAMFVNYFGPCMDCLKDVFIVPSIFGKLKCLTKSLTKVTEAVQELRQQVLEKVDDDNRFSLAITADDLLPLMVLIMLQMDPVDAASIVVELKMMEDLIPRFLSSGCHGYALVEFDMASKVLQSLCSQFDLSNLLSMS